MLPVLHLTACIHVDSSNPVCSSFVSSSFSLRPSLYPSNFPALTWGHGCLCLSSLPVPSASAPHACSLCSGTLVHTHDTCTPIAHSLPATFQSISKFLPILTPRLGHCTVLSLSFSCPLTLNSSSSSVSRLFLWARSLFIVHAYRGHRSTLVAVP